MAYQPCECHQFLMLPSSLPSASHLPPSPGHLLMQGLLQNMYMMYRYYIRPLCGCLSPQYLIQGCFDGKSFFKLCQLYSLPVMVWSSCMGQMSCIAVQSYLYWLLVSSYSHCIDTPTCSSCLQIRSPSLAHSVHTLRTQGLCYWEDEYLGVQWCTQNNNNTSRYGCAVTLSSCLLFQTTTYRSSIWGSVDEVVCPYGF